MKLFNTLSGKKEILRRPKGRPLNLFVCGPTVYDYSHIGHARTYLFFDILVRWLRFNKYKIFYLQNITDVDDRIIDRAKKENKNPLSLARFFEKQYCQDMKKLEIISVNRYARASEHIKKIQQQISSLLKKGFAYQNENGVYFEVRKFKDYGKLSHQNLEAIRPGWRIEPDPQKKDPLDFALWKKMRINADQNTDRRGFKIINGEPSWPSPWGWGRSGWHIEDTAITQKFFGPQYDLHGAGVELKFPHHESEIAQQESASGKKPFVRIWLHVGSLLVNGEKMSKSLGNFITVREFLEKFKELEGTNLLRWIILNHHYRSPIDYSLKLIEQAQKSLSVIQEFLEKIKIVKNAKRKMQNVKLQFEIQNYNKLFTQAMDNDFNTPKAIATIFELISFSQNKVWQLSPSQIEKIENFISEKLKIFGIVIKPAKIPTKIKDLAAKREKLRNNQQFIQADRLRKKIEALGYRVEDTDLGPFVKYMPGSRNSTDSPKANKN